ncbi:hypothetical protein PSCT_04341 [Pseudomonas sp. SCT]|jgi:hypothetical protein|uniref:hypothetical protein n=1 Tax=Pseudomonas sp. (strain SCT) TaxID=412955 RepID=UPI000EEB0FDC|nr:hypothetical protein [Pseudomonas sp. SCT]GCA58121.1 hypothetical protein PSCT_04341 [Pseudomonas sp. SCT]
MLAKLIITFGALLYGLGVPLLEINQTHVFNPQWEPHMRLHEVWQLATNSALALLALWLAWARNNISFVAGAVSSRLDAVAVHSPGCGEVPRRAPRRSR